MRRGCDDPPGGRSVSALVAVLAALLACQGSGSRPAEDPEPPPKPPPAQPITTAEWTPTPAPATPTGTAPVTTNDAPEISKSAGADGGVVVLWPRIVLPRNAGKPDVETRGIAGRVQARLADAVRRALPGRTVDVRPEPERVCPKQGCNGVSVGALMARAGGGCSVVALVSGPGPSAQRLVQWSPGLVRINAPTVPFREPPESVVKVDDYAACAKLPDDLAVKDAEVEAALKAAAGT